MIEEITSRINIMKEIEIKKMNRISDSLSKIKKDLLIDNELTKD